MDINGLFLAPLFDDSSCSLQANVTSVNDSSSAWNGPFFGTKHLWLFLINIHIWARSCNPSF